MKVEITLLEPMLGTVPFNREVVKEYVESKNPNGVDEEVLRNIPEEVEKMSTGYHRDDSGKPFIFNYLIKGFFKAAASSLIRAKQQKMKAYLKTIDGLVFVYPRKLYTTEELVLPLQFLERPLRGRTAQGERICLARSEVIPEGNTFEFEIQTLDDDLTEYIEQWLDYGKYAGLGQWRNAGYGSFTWKYV